MKRIVFATLMVLTLSSFANAQEQKEILMHSHNDYARLAPFWLAYSQRASSIECDMFYVGGSKFLIGHGRDDFSYNQIFDDWYLKPIVQIYRYNHGRAWADDDKNHLQLCIDIKSDDPDAFVKALVKKLKKYPDVFDSSVNPLACRVVVGFDQKYMDEYPILSFDGNVFSEYTPAQLERVALFSEFFGDFSHWNGRDPLPAEDEARLKDAIARAHAMGRPIRFWDAPDNETAWEKLIELGADYINTDKPAELRMFLKERQAPNSLDPR